MCPKWNDKFEIQNKIVCYETRVTPYINLSSVGVPFLRKIA